MFHTAMWTRRSPCSFHCARATCTRRCTPHRPRACICTLTGCGTLRRASRIFTAGSACTGQEETRGDHTRKKSDNVTYVRCRAVGLVCTRGRPLARVEVLRWIGARGGEPEPFPQQALPNPLHSTRSTVRTSVRTYIPIVGNSGRAVYVDRAASCFSLVT